MIYNIISIVIVHLFAFFIMLYYCDGVMEYKESPFKSHCIMIIGSAVYCAICMFGITNLNITSGFVIYCFIIYLGYKCSIGRTLFQVAILIALMMFAELIVALIMNFKIGDMLYYPDTYIEDIIIILMSKSIYFVSVVLFKHIAENKNNIKHSKEMIWLIILPITTCLFLFLFNQLYGLLDKVIELLFVVCGIMLIISNFVVYVVGERIVDKNIKIQRLQAIEHKHEMDNKSFQLMKEKYDELKIIAHDFNKYCNNIEGLLTKEQNEALLMIQKLKNRNKEFLLVEYTNNAALNILLSQKMKECNDEHINFQLYAKDIDLSFIEEIDVVAIFANLIDNAMESCRISLTKKIFFSINIMNNSYIVIRVDNSADKEPVVINNHLSSWKHDKENHGIGFLSIQKSLSKYNGSLRWSYDNDTRTFTTIILINLP